MNNLKIISDKCVCGNTYGMQGEGTCDMKCSGNSSQTCGGQDSVSVGAHLNFE